MTTAARQADPAGLNIVKIADKASSLQPQYANLPLITGKFDLNKITETRYNCVCTLKRIRAMN